MTVLSTPSESQLNFLRQSAVWASLSEESLREIAAAMGPRQFAAGDLIIRQGEPGRDLHVLQSGTAEIRIHTSGGVTGVAVVGPGHCVGEMSLLTGDSTSADVVALEACETLALDQTAFNKLIASHPHLLREFVRMVSRRLRDTDQAIGAARAKEDRIAHFLRDAKSEQYDELIGKHPAIRDLQRQINEVAGSGDPVLIQGERGTGKELIARLVHFRGKWRESPLLSADGAEIADTPWGDKLFGVRAEVSGGSDMPRTACYMDLADGGAILLKNIDALPPAVQERLAAMLRRPRSAGGQWNVRIMATCRGDIAELAAAGRISRALSEALTAHIIQAPPLRERKKDLPELATHFVRKHAKRLGKKVEGLSSGALTRLVSYDYRIGNVQELEEAIERAVILAEDITINAEEIHLGAPPAEASPGYNLLRLPAPWVRVFLKAFPYQVRILVGLFFLFVLLECLFAPVGRNGNLGTLLVWQLWWPVLALSFVLGGRIWCSVCPMALGGHLAQRVVNANRKIPAWLKDHDASLALAGFVLIVWVEEATGMRSAPRATGGLLLGILAGAVTASVLFPRRTWCRHLCPLGALGGVCSGAAVLELRSTPDICNARCKGHSCYKGEGQIAGCPMFNHVMFLDSNQRCVLCLDCVRSCPNGSPQLNLRLPGRELWSAHENHPALPRMVAVLLGVLIAIGLLQAGERGWPPGAAGLLQEHRLLFVSVDLLLAAAIPLLILRLAHRRGTSLEASPWPSAGAWVPLIAGGFLAYQVRFFPGMDKLQLTLGYPGAVGENGAPLAAPMLDLAVTLILSAGLLLSAFIVWKLGRSQTTRDPRGLWSLLGMVAYCVVLGGLLWKP